MTGNEFSVILRQLGMTQVQLAEHWGVARTTVVRIAGSEQVPQPYADAIRYLQVSTSVDALQLAVAKTRKGVQDDDV